jgi:hypothetical protein
MTKELDLYTDYLLSSFGSVTATGLSHLLDGSLSHDQITRTLSGHEYCSKDLWHEVKPLVRAHQSEDACLIFDDTIISKPRTILFVGIGITVKVATKKVDSLSIYDLYSSATYPCFI